MLDTQRTWTDGCFFEKLLKGCALEGLMCTVLWTTTSRDGVRGFEDSEASAGATTKATRLATEAGNVGLVGGLNQRSAYLRNTGGKTHSLL